MRRRLKTALTVLTLMTLGLLTAAQPALADSYDRAVDITMPVKGSYSDDYDAGRSGGRVHRATDLFAKAGTPVRAAVGGTVTWAPASEHPTAGFALQVRGNDGRTYAYYHLGKAGGSRSGALAKGIDSGTRVKRGEVIGYLGNSGNARTTPPHLHFEIHDSRVRDPHGSDRINPYASLKAAKPAGQSGNGGGEQDEAPSHGGSGSRYVVRVGDTLSKIARSLGLSSWRPLHDANPSVSDPDVIHPGQRLRTP